jgi:hypothetical protein
VGKTAGVPVAVKVDAASFGKEANRRASKCRYHIAGAEPDFVPSEF